jgi:hypothetical protein
MPYATMRIGLGDKLQKLGTGERILAALIAIVGVIVLWLTGWTLFTIIWEGPTVAESLASIVSGISSLLLIGLTGWYVVETRKMVGETRQARIDDQQARQREKQEKKENLRIALYEEIGKIQYIDDLQENYSIGYSAIDFLVPRTVYEANSDELGRLSAEEVSLVVEFYTRAEEVESMIKTQRERDYPHDKDAVTEYFRIISLILDKVSKALSLGLHTPESQRREEHIRNRITRLAEAQEAALKELRRRSNTIEESEESERLSE